MDKDSVLKLANELKAEHGFEDVPVVFSRTKSSLGRAWWQGGVPFKIDLSSYWMENLPVDEVRDTILHEIAHLMAGHTAGHGAAWVEACRRIGARPSRTSVLSREVVSSVRAKISRYRAVCSSCGFEHFFHRMTRNWKNGRYGCRCGGRLEVDD
jgi:predicted SprT family Zn-dependent metalloprotease